MFKVNTKKSLVTIAMYFMLASVLAAAIMTGTNYKQLLLTLSGGGDTGSSTKYRTTGSVISGIAGKAESPSYKTKAGFVSQVAVTSKVLPATDLSDTHVYPNPYKPGSGGDFDTEYITFKRLTIEATIRVFNIAGELCATIEKEDTAVDYYEWNATNDAGEKLASGVYIYYITNPDGESNRGKFAIIK